jgi:hypothetical protein
MVRPTCFGNDGNEIAMKKILALHGYAQNAGVFYDRTKVLREALQCNGYELVYMDGTVAERVSKSEAKKLDGEEGLTYSWWITNTKTSHHDGFEETINRFGKVLESQGPFVGVIGFSQGGAAAVALTSLIEQKRHHRLTGIKEITHPPFKFCLLYAGFPMRFEKEYSFLYEPKVHTPILQIMGRRDTMISFDRMQRLGALCASYEEVFWDGPHTIPRSEAMTQLALNFVSTQHSMAKL